MTGRALVAALVVAGLTASCGGGRDPAPRDAREPAAEATRPRCDVIRGRAPEGFVLVRTSERPHPDHLGLHIVYRAPGGARLDYLLGVAGEIGEGLPFEGNVQLASGEDARLLGRGDTWALVWPEPPPCRQSAILGNGMARGEFSEVLEGTGILS